MSLPNAWVDRIFEKLTLVYGHQFLGRWAGLDLDAVKADWAHELRGLQQSPHAIAHGLAHLPPGEPPTVLQFRQACSRAPEYFPPALKRPEATPEQKAAVRETLARVREKLTGRRKDDQTNPTEAKE